MIQGTASDVGKSIITTGLCRIFSDDGYKVAPFKSQNMSGNSFITAHNKEIAKSIAIQAYAARTVPHESMNPILLKPVSDVGSQVVLNGEYFDTMKAGEYYKNKKRFRDSVVGDAFELLNKSYDIVVIEGAGSPAEINLKKNDFVNMGMAKLARSPVVLVGDIDRGGVFASLAGTMLLLDDEERSFVKGIVINKFRGDVSLLEPGLVELEKIVDRPVLGVLSYLDVDIEKEDSLSLGNGDAGTERYTDEHMERNIQRLAECMKNSLDMDRIYKILVEGVSHV
jgi:cobyric acid synthase CobQ